MVIDIQTSLLKAKKIAICGWELSHNATGRVVTLAEMYQYAGYINITMIGCLLQTKQHSKQLWQPIKNHSIACQYFELESSKSSQLIPNALAFVIAHPFNIIHLSKPRITNIVIGFLYKIIWQAKVIMDIDDEELAFTKTQTDISVNELLAMIPNKATIPPNIKDEFWTQLSVGLVSYFDEIVVSNPALQQRYGGEVLPHIRDERKFMPSTVLTQTNRKKYSVAEDAIVVLFFGTPKRHKGLLETANALSKINDSRVIFLIVGDFVEPELKQELLAIPHVAYQFLPNQPYETAKDIVSLGDICVLMQETENEISRFQLPAKLIDALAMGLKVLLQPSPATQYIAESGYVQTVTKDNLKEHLAGYLADFDPNFSRNLDQQYHYFLQHLSMQAYVPFMQQLVETPALCYISPHTKPYIDLNWFRRTHLSHQLTSQNLLQFLHYCVTHHVPISQKN